MEQLAPTPTLAKELQISPLKETKPIVMVLLAFPIFTCEVLNALILELILTLLAFKFKVAVPVCVLAPDPTRLPTSTLLFTLIVPTLKVILVCPLGYQEVKLFPLCAPKSKVALLPNSIFKFPHYFPLRCSYTDRLKNKCRYHFLNWL